MIRKLFTSAFFLELVFTALAGHSQYAYHSAAPILDRPTGASSEKTPKATSYKVVHGVVQGQQGALPGATIWLHGTRTVVVTNSEGEFELRMPAAATVAQLICSYGGLHDETVTLAPVQALGSLYLLHAGPVVGGGLTAR